MKIFQYLRNYLAMLGVEPPQPFKKNHSMKVFLKRLLVFILFILWLIWIVIFIVCEAEQIDEYADAFYIATCLITILSVFPIILWKTDSLFEVIGDFEKIIQQRMENPDWKSTYVKLNENIEKYTSVFFFFIVKVTVPGVFIPHFMFSFYLYFATDMGGEAFSLPYPIWTPFNWRTPIGYLVICTIECSVVSYMAHIGFCFIATLVASCYIILTFCNDIKSDLHALDGSSKAGESTVALMKRVKNIVEFHTKTKQMVSNVDNIFALIIVVFFLWGLSTICSILLVVQMELERNVSLIEVIRPIFQAIWSFNLLFLICEFGQMLTNHFDQLNDAINDCDWTSFPKEIQKILPTIIQNAQRPVVLRTVEDASCSRETFKRVVNKGFSCFMVFRRFR